MKSIRYALLFLLVTLSAEAAEFQEGVHYQRLPVPVDTQDASKVEVVELFSYACIHCKNFDPMLESWRAEQADDVLFRRVPAIFDKTWEFLAQAFYTAQVLNIGDEVHQPIFRALHDRGVNLVNPSLMAALFQEVGGVAPDEFTSVFNSFSVRSRVQQADAHGRAYRVTGVPMLIVDGVYRIDGKMAGSNTNMLKIVDFLVAERRGSGRRDDPAAISAAKTE
ncbi:MAG: thiol:disulfide interchange protein DsbA/DsbL [Gammaproteobacteria bacterium]|nr:thiol:disulfide interchange protein DsbA/DsbL [Gammaproteobacteria bacterium]